MVSADELQFPLSSDVDKQNCLICGIERLQEGYQAPQKENVIMIWFLIFGESITRHSFLDKDSVTGILIGLE